MVHVVITDLTRMSGTRICIAGYSLENGRPIECIRPELTFDSLVESWLYSSEGVMRPFAVADFTLLQHRPSPPHIEDWIVERRYTLVTDFAPDLIEPVSRRRVPSRSNSSTIAKSSPSTVGLCRRKPRHDRSVRFVRGASSG